MKIFIASDHGGFDVKEQIRKIDFSTIENEIGDKIEIIDCGTNSKERCDYPVFAKIALNKLKDFINDNIEENPKHFGILVCTTGIGMSIIANKQQGIRAGLCHCIEEAELTRKHNNSNVLCIGAKFTDKNTIENIVKTFITTKFEGGRHLERIKMIENK